MNLRQAAAASAATQSVIDAEDIACLERRWARRKDVATAASILSPELPIPVPCIVRDLSSTGARLDLVSTRDNLIGARTKLPNVFTLVIRVDRIEVECATAWRRAGLVGVRFLSTPRPMARVAR